VNSVFPPGASETRGRRGRSTVAAVPFDLDPLESHLLDRLRALPAGSHGDASDAEPLWRAQRDSRLCDFAARYLQTRGRSFYSIGSAGHESNAAVALALRPTDPALLHYRSGAFYLARAGQAGRDGVPDVLRGVTAARDEPIAGGRHKVFGNRELAVIPQTSTIASHLPRAVGVAFAVERAARLGTGSPWPQDAVVVCNCLNITDKDIEQAVKDGARTWDQLQAATKIGTVCGGCKPRAEELLHEFAHIYGD